MDVGIAAALYLVATLGLICWAYHRALGPQRNHYIQSDWVLAARFIYVLAYLVIFIGLTFVIAFGGQLGLTLAGVAQDLLHFAPEVKKGLVKETTQLAPLFSFGLIYFGVKLEFINKADERMLAWLHSSEHLESELLKVRAALESKPFQPSEVESAENRRTLREYHIRITDNRLIGQDVELVTLWQKVACLTSRAKEWQETDIKVLDVAEEKELREIEESHKRKTEHASNIIRALDHSRRQGWGVQNAMHLSGQPLFEQVQDTALLHRPDGLHDAAPYPLEIGAEDLEKAIKNIQHYFLREYDILLHRITALVAKSIVYSGKESIKRLQSLKDSGYQELGEINRLSVDSIIKFFCGTLIIVLCLSVLLFIIAPNSGPDSVQVVKAGLFLSFALLCGSMIGSNRSHGRQPETPWAAFASAGVMSLVLFLFVNLSFALTDAFITRIEGMSTGTISAQSGTHIQDLLKNLSFGWVRIGGEKHQLAFTDILPWALIPTFASVAICRISRVDWSDQFGKATSRIRDGLSLAAVFFSVAIVAFALHCHFQTKVSDVLRYFSQHRLEHEGVWGGAMVMSGFLALVGLAIGCVVIADIRKIARSEI